MQYQVNFQYRPRQEGARPQDEPMVDASGNSVDIQFDSSALMPNIGDHVVFLRAGGEYQGDKYVSKVEQIEGVVENRLFMFFSPSIVSVNIVVTDSEVGSEMLMKS